MNQWTQKILTSTLILAIAFPGNLWAQNTVSASDQSAQHQANVKLAMTPVQAGFLGSGALSKIAEGDFAIQFGLTTILTAAVLSGLEISKGHQISAHMKAIIDQAKGSVNDGFRGMQLSEYAIMNSKERWRNYFHQRYIGNLPEQQKLTGIERILSELDTVIQRPTLDASKKLQFTYIIPGSSGATHAFTEIEMNNLAHLMQHDSSPELLKRLVVLDQFVKKLNTITVGGMLDIYGVDVIQEKFLADIDLGENFFRDLYNLMAKNQISPLTISRARHVNLKALRHKILGNIDQLDYNANYFKSGDFLFENGKMYRIVGASLAVGLILTLIFYKGSDRRYGSLEKYSLNFQDWLATLQSDPETYRSMMEEDTELAELGAAVAKGIQAEVRKADAQIKRFDQYIANNRM